jgi:hypothetical protein
MRTVRKLLGMSTENIRPIIGEIQRGLAKSRFRAQGIGAETNV